jgi:hypothetical protein
MLKEIARDVPKVMNEMLQTDPQTEQAKPRVGETGGRDAKMYDYKKQSMGRILLTIQNRALRKAEYLKTLKKFYSSTHMRDVADFKKMIGQVQQSDQDLIGIYHGSRMEMIDPYHRNFEIREGRYQWNHNQLQGYDMGQGFGDMNFSAGDYSFAFATWFNTASQYPFFLWLEDNVVCLGDVKDLHLQHLKKIGYTDLRKKNPIVPSQGANKMVQLCMVEPGQHLLHSGAPGGKPVGVCDTSNYNAPMRKGGVGYAAYVFSEHGDLFIAEHLDGEWHHSSFLSGNPVRCAGMIKIVQGKVTGVNNHSGHYRPRTRHLYKFVEKMANYSVLGQTVDIELSDPPDTRFDSWPSFQKWYLSKFAYG